MSSAISKIIVGVLVVLVAAVAAAYFAMEPVPPPSPAAAAAPETAPAPAPRDPSDELSGYGACPSSALGAPGSGQGVFRNLRGHYDNQGRYVVLIDLDGRVVDPAAPLQQANAKNATFMDFPGEIKFQEELYNEIGQGPVSMARLGSHPGFIRVSLNYHSQESPLKVAVEVRCKADGVALRYAFEGIQSAPLAQMDSSEIAPKSPSATHGQAGSSTPSQAFSNAQAQAAQAAPEGQALGFAQTSPSGQADETGQAAQAGDAGQAVQTGETRQAAQPARFPTDQALAAPTSETPASQNPQSPEILVPLLSQGNASDPGTIEAASAPQKSPQDSSLAGSQEGAQEGSQESSQEGPMESPAENFNGRPEIATSPEALKDASASLSAPASYPKDEAPQEVAQIEPQAATQVAPHDELADFAACQPRDQGQAAIKSVKGHYDAQGRYVVVADISGSIGPFKFVTDKTINPVATYIDFAGAYSFRKDLHYQPTGPVRQARVGTHPGFLRLSLTYRANLAPNDASLEILCREGAFAVRYAFEGGKTQALAKAAFDKANPELQTSSGQTATAAPDGPPPNAEALSETPSASPNSAGRASAAQEASVQASPAQASASPSPKATEASQLEADLLAAAEPLGSESPEPVKTASNLIESIPPEVALPVSPDADSSRLESDLLAGAAPEIPRPEEASPASSATQEAVAHFAASAAAMAAGEAAISTGGVTAASAAATAAVTGQADELDDYLPCEQVEKGSGAIGALNGFYDRRGRYVIEASIKGTVGKSRLITDHTGSQSVTFLELSGRYNFDPLILNSRMGPVAFYRMAIHDQVTRFSLTYRDHLAPKTASAEILCGDGKIAIRYSFHDLFDPDAAAKARARLAQMAPQTESSLNSDLNANTNSDLNANTNSDLKAALKEQSSPQAEPDPQGGLSLERSAASDPQKPAQAKAQEEGKEQAMAQANPSPTPNLASNDELYGYGFCPADGAGQAAFKRISTHYDDQGRLVFLVRYEGTLGARKIANILDAPIPSSYVELLGKYQAAEAVHLVRSGPLRQVRLGNQGESTRIGFTWREKYPPKKADAEIYCLGDKLAIRYAFGEGDPAQISAKALALPAEPLAAAPESGLEAPGSPKRALGAKPSNEANLAPKLSPAAQPSQDATLVTIKRMNAEFRDPDALIFVENKTGSSKTITPTPGTKGSRPALPTAKPSARSSSAPQSEGNLETSSFQASEPSPAGVPQAGEASIEAAVETLMESLEEASEEASEITAHQTDEPSLSVEASQALAPSNHSEPSKLSELSEPSPAGLSQVKEASIEAMVEALVETSVEATVEAPIEVAVEASEANQAGEPSLAANVVQAPKLSELSELSELSKPAGVSQAVEAAAADYAQVVESAPINFVQAEESWLIKFFKARKSALINLFQGEEPAEANLAQVEEAPIVNFHHVGRPALAARANQAEESRDPPQTPAPSAQTTAPENPLAASVKEAEESQNPPQTPAPSKQAAAPEGPLSGFAGCAPTGQGYGTITALRGEFLPPDRYAVFLSINGHWGDLYHDESLNGAPKSFHTLFGGDYKALVKSAREIQGPVSITTLSIRKGLLKVTMDFLDRQTPASVSVATLCRGDELALIHTFHNKTASK